jgi:hypothetical protein
MKQGRLDAFYAKRKASGAMDTVTDATGKVAEPADRQQAAAAARKRRSAEPATARCVSARAVCACNPCSPGMDAGDAPHGGLCGRAHRRAQPARLLPWRALWGRAQHVSRTRPVAPTSAHSDAKENQAPPAEGVGVAAKGVGAASTPLAEAAVTSAGGKQPVRSLPAATAPAGGPAKPKAAEATEAAAAAAAATCSTAQAATKAAAARQLVPKRAQQTFLDLGQVQWGPGGPPPRRRAKAGAAQGAGAL